MVDFMIEDLRMVHAQLNYFLDLMTDVLNLLRNIGESARISRIVVLHRTNGSSCGARQRPQARNIYILRTSSLFTRPANSFRLEYFSASWIRIF